MDYVPVELEIDRYHNKGVGHLNSKEYGKALEMFKKEVDCYPDGCIGYWFIAKTLREMGKEKEARENYKVALGKAEKMRELGPEMIDKEMINAIRKDSDSLGGEKDSDTTEGK